ncbi:alcohol dehydrogenase catalytic domain-containing protein [Diaphorobacter sp. HDW4B]|uniref:alcohol dehydrogenase catalytic domain-containing protein n=1 Tax=Diaphorobacter sp. HDW4B TaxID=2714925 RepID=UPI00140B7B0E|nr:alcohol dehydrogenase catalytic domain-containing protein [Diaphorobacter sp. HDW4B]QIL69337.1 alcohol dehydrogenase catalytic domain-containing protein [Diaphorobacter sp. HDW4B]
MKNREKCILKSELAGDAGGFELMLSDGLDVEFPGPGKVLIDVKACEVVLGKDCAMCTDDEIQRSQMIARGQMVAGRVRAVGTGVASFAIGDSIAARVEPGGLTSVIMAPAHGCYRLPDGMSFAIGAALGESFQMAYIALSEYSEFQNGCSILVFGVTSELGSSIVQLAKSAGASIIIGTVSHTTQVEDAVALGCDHVLDFSKGDDFRRLSDFVSSVTNGSSLDIAVGTTVCEHYLAALNAASLVVRGLCVRDSSIFVSRRIDEQVAWLRGEGILIMPICVGLAPAKRRAIQESLFALWIDGLFIPRNFSLIPESRISQLSELTALGVGWKKIILVSD